MCPVAPRRTTPSAAAGPIDESKASLDSIEVRLAEGNARHLVVLRDREVQGKQDHRNRQDDDHDADDPTLNRRHVLTFRPRSYLRGEHTRQGIACHGWRLRS